MNTTLCRFCLKVIQDQNFDIVGDITLQLLNVLSIKMDLSTDQQSLLCSDCQDTIEKCFNFKSTCISSEDSIAEYIAENSKLDLEEVYLKQVLKQKSNKIPKGHKICRLCMKITAKYLNSTNNLFILANERLQKCIPEINLNVVKHPVICDACHIGLQSYFEFVTNCLDVENKINRYCEARGVDKRQVQLYDVLQFTIKEESKSNFISECTVLKNVGKFNEDQPNFEINYTKPSAEYDHKTEKKEVKSEDDNKGCSSTGISKNSEVELNNEGQVQCPEADQFIQNGDIIFTKEEYDLDTEKQQMASLAELLKKENADDNRPQFPKQYNFMEGGIIEMYVNNGEIETKSKNADMSNANDYLLQDDTHQSKSYKKKHKRKQKRKKFLCEICSTTFSGKQILVNHNLCIHGVEPEINYKCDQCSFKTVYKQSLNKHRKVHKGNSEFKMHKCKECEFKTKYKNNLKSHSLARHQDLEVLELKKQIATDKSNPEVPLYNCGLCPYKTIDKRHMKYHAMTHKDKSELVTFDCFHCSYKAKRKQHLLRHLINHKTPPELKHKSSRKSQLKKFKCKICLYQTTSRTALMRHSFTHPEVKQVTYKCPHCLFRTMYKHYLKTHLLIHKDKNPVEFHMLKCVQCSYQTIHKNNFERHMQCHTKSSIAELWQCEVCGGNYNKYHIKQHQRNCVVRDPCNGETTNKQSA